MKKMMIMTVLLMAALVHAEDDGVRGKVGRLADKGGKMAEKGAEATDKGLNKAADATARPFKKADEWVSDKLKLGSRGASAPAAPSKSP
jgi:hypothetical protein